MGLQKFVNQLQRWDRAMEFLQELHDRYATIRSQILLMDPFLNANKNLFTCETRRKAKRSSSIRRNSRSGSPCYTKSLAPVAQFY